MAPREARPEHRRIGLWGEGLGKVLRFEAETADPVALLGMELEYSRSAV